LCNKHIKFDFLLKQAEERGADIVATGHYARTERASDVGRWTSSDEQRATYDTQRYLLKKGVDPVKDQSYVLYVMKQEELAKTVLPLGGMNKDQTRSIARKLGLSTAMRAESQEICFVGNEKYAEFIKGFAPEALQPGPIVDTAGKVVGRHEGIAFYTIGQRKGLGISSPVPRYVADIDRKNSTIVIGSREDAMKLRFKVKEMNWIAIPLLTRPVKAGVKIRSTTGEMPATITPEETGHVLVEFDEPQWAPAPGQSAVFYEDDIVLGGGVIE
jgi:tRNA-specific 2-thiouridylase